MSSPTPDAVQENLRLAGVTGGAAIAAILDSSTPFSKIQVANTTSTTAALMTLVGKSTLSAQSASMQQTLVQAAGATTFTTTGYVRVTVTDASGNITAGDHYIRIGSLT